MDFFSKHAELKLRIFFKMYVVSLVFAMSSSLGYAQALQLLKATNVHWCMMFEGRRRRMEDGRSAVLDWSPYLGRHDQSCAL